MKMCNCKAESTTKVETEREDYLNSCKIAGCQLNGPVTYHKSCGSQYRLWCKGCGVMLRDSADDEIGS